MRIIVNGACGHMGRILVGRAEAAGHTVAAAVDRYGKEGVYASLDDYTGDADVIIDFSHHSATRELCAYAEKRNIPLVIATTGHTDAEIARIHDCAAGIPLFFSYNMSLGVALLIDLAKKAAAVMKNADIEIVEIHHNRKLDAPSGTAKMIFEGIKEVLPEKTAHCGRAGMAAREKNEIGISSLRMGSVVGVHEVHVCTDSQCLTLRHEAFSRDLFADGALSAAEFLADRPAGLYTMKDLV